MIAIGRFNCIRYPLGPGASAIRDASIYITHTPCIQCFKVLINTGIVRICNEKEYKLHTLQPLLEYTPQVQLQRVSLPE